MSFAPRKLFSVCDFVVLLVAYLTTAWIAPFLHSLLAPGGPLYAEWVGYLAPAPFHGSFPPLSEYLWVLLLVAPATVICVEILGGHRPISQQSPARIVLFSVTSPFVGVAMLSTVFFILKTPGYSRLIVFSFAGASCIALCLSRFVGRAWHSYIVQEGMRIEEVAVIGTPEAARVVAQRIAQTTQSHECRLVGYFSLLDDVGPLRVTDSIQLPALGDVDDLERVLIHLAIQRIVMVLPDRDGNWLDGAIRTCDYFRVTADIVPEAILSAPLDDLVAQTNGTPGKVPALTLAPPEAESEWLYLKRVLDVCASGILLILLAPVFLLIAIAIKLTTPHLTVFYPWRVVGYRGRRFTGYKFTTMVADADEKRDQLAALNEMTGPVFKIAKDPRVTPLGRFLRKYSLNELPQLWSVFKGDMSLVGPRPAGPHELERYQLWQKRKLTAQPGITCFWQVRGRNRISNFDDWVRMDLEYIRNRSLWLDCKILAKTAWVVVRGTGS
jgi:exopolysaccharide biosynthesis polyprenyl glycosylphosphotransferase